MPSLAECSITAVAEVRRIEINYIEGVAWRVGCEDAFPSRPTLDRARRNEATRLKANDIREDLNRVADSRRACETEAELSISGEARLIEYRRNGAADECAIDICR